MAAACALALADWRARVEVGGAAYAAALRCPEPLDSMPPVASLPRFRVGRPAVATLALAGALTACGDDGIQPNPARAASIEVSAGGGQVAEVTETLPIAPAVLVRDSGGRPLAGVVVSFVARAGQVARASARTNASGVASPGPWRLPERSGLDTLVATVSGLAPFRMTARARAAAAAALTLANPTGFQSRVFEPLDLPVFRVVDRFGNGVPGIPVTLAVLDRDGEMPKSVVQPASEPTDDFGIVGATSWTPYVVGEHRGAASAANGAFTATATRRVREDACGARRVIGFGMSATFDLDAASRVAGCADTLHVVTVVTTTAARLTVQSGPRTGTPFDDPTNVRSAWLTRAPAWAANPQVLIQPSLPATSSHFITNIQPGNYDIRIGMPRAGAGFGTSLQVTVAPLTSAIVADAR